MIADTLTKALSSMKVKHFASEFGLAMVWGGVLNTTTHFEHLPFFPLTYLLV